jgi:hypothetical protein
VACRHRVNDSSRNAMQNCRLRSLLEVDLVLVFSRAFKPHRQGIKYATPRQVSLLPAGGRKLNQLHSLQLLLSGATLGLPSPLPLGDNLLLLLPPFPASWRSFGSRHQHCDTAGRDPRRRDIRPCRSQNCPRRCKLRLPLKAT